MSAVVAFFQVDAARVKLHREDRLLVTQSQRCVARRPRSQCLHNAKTSQEQEGSVRAVQTSIAPATTPARTTAAPLRPATLAGDVPEDDEPSVPVARPSAADKSEAAGGLAQVVHREVSVANARSMAVGEGGLTLS